MSVNSRIHSTLSTIEDHSSADTERAIVPSLTSVNGDFSSTIEDNVSKSTSTSNIDESAADEKESEQWIPPDQTENRLPDHLDDVDVMVGSFVGTGPLRNARIQESLSQGMELLEFHY